MGLKHSPWDPIFFQCFDTVGWVIWPVKTYLNMTYNVFGGTLNLTQPSTGQKILVTRLWRDSSHFTARKWKVAFNPPEYLWIPYWDGAAVPTSQPLIWDPRLHSFEYCLLWLARHYTMAFAIQMTSTLIVQCVCAVHRYYSMTKCHISLTFLT